MHYILENVGRYSKQTGRIISNIILEERKGHDYGRLIRYLVKVRDDANNVRGNLSYSENNYKNADYLKCFKFEDIINPKPKKDSPLLKLADVTASALRKTCVLDKYNITEKRYIEEMQKLFFSNEEGQVVNHGIRAVINLSKMNIEQSSLQFLLNLKNEATAAGSQVA